MATPWLQGIEERHVHVISNVNASTRSWQRDAARCQASWSTNILSIFHDALTDQSGCPRDRLSR